MTNPILDKAKEHYKEKLNQGPRVVHIPEWECDVYVYPANLAVRDKLYKYISQNSLEALAESIILRAKNKDGLSIFSKADKDDLMKRVDPEVLARVAMDINDDMVEEIEVAVEEAEKN